MKKSIISLSFGTFGLGIAEFGMMSILSFVAESLNLSIAKTGHFISVYALGVCVGALLLVFFLKGRSLKTLLLILMTIMCLGNLLAVMAFNYHSMIIARFISGLPHGAYFGVAGVAAKQLAEENKQTAAVCLVLAGMTFANLLGIPIASYISHVFSWHMLFLSVVLWGLFTIFSIWKWVPNLSPVEYKGFFAQFEFLKHRMPWLLLAAIVLGNSGLFCWYSYINPIMVDTAHFAQSSMSVIMIIAGAGMVFGNFTSSKLSEHISPAATAMIMCCLMFISSFLMIFSSSYKIPALILMFIGVFGLFGVSGPEQYLIIRTAVGGEVLGASSAQIAFNLGNALGAYMGGIAVDITKLPQYSAIPGIFLCSLGIISLFVFRKFYKRNINK